MNNSVFNFLIIIIMSTQTSCSQEHKHTNKLIEETSPYLLQHAHNPVNWYPYGEEAFAKAKAEDKLILFSIGYAACHWCHVMEHQSFENEDIAKIMNDKFICVKVDKEERPDVDQIYMNAIQLLTGSGGWPLNCFALPDGRPIWGGTYFQPKKWVNVLNSLSSNYEFDKPKFERAAKELTDGITNTELVSVKSDEPMVNNEEFKTAIESLKQRFDHNDGGFMGSPKFPMPGIYEMMLDYSLINDDKELLEHISSTMKKWAYGGIYDQLGGGFARYSVDAQWLIPHFEKMLYDNGQLVGLYAKMYRVTKDPEFKRIIDETVAWTKRDLTAEDGLFYASYDADSEGEEGTFYVWTKEEIDKILGDDSKIFCDYYGITDGGNFEGKNNPNVESMTAPTAKIIELRTKLFDIREKREKPGLDNKTLSSWSALMISGLSESYLATGNTEHLDMATKAANTIIEKHITKDGDLLRLYKSNNSVEGFMEDYSLVIKSFIDLYKATFNEKWLNKAVELSDKAEQLFFDGKSDMYFYTSVNENVVVRKMEITDNVIPSSNAVMAQNLYELAIILEDEKKEAQAIQMAKNTKKQSLANPNYSYNWLQLMLRIQSQKKEVVIIGENAQKEKTQFLKNYYPTVVITGSEKANENLPLLKNRFQADKTLFYYCVDNTCKMPVEKISDLENNMIK